MASHINLDEINTIKFNKNESIELAINYNNIDYYMKIFLKDFNDHLIIFSNGAINPKKKLPPVYMRSSWANDIEASCIFLDDPTVHGENLKLGWGQGPKNHFALEELAVILREVISYLQFETENVYFYGSSAGGFMSAYFSILIHDTTAIVNNPQTKVFNYIEPYVKRMLNHSYEIKNIEEIPENLLYRMDLAEAMIHYKSTPKKLYYLQNYLQEDDVENHLKPFLFSLKEKGIECTGLYLMNYFSTKLGHNPLPKEITLKYIHQIIDGKLDMEF